MYEIIEKNEYGVLVKNTTKHHSCKLCKYKYGESCYVTNCADGYFLTDQEAAKLELESDSQKELIDLQIENDQLKERIKELERKKSTELITKNEGSFYQETITKCCGIGMITNDNFCPNCGRKIMR